MKLESFDPATGERVGAVEITPVEAIPEVVARARAAQEGWAALDIRERARRVAAVGPLLIEELDALSELLTREMGKPLRSARGEIKSCGTGLESEMEEIVGALQPEILEDGRTRTTLHRDPYGVVAAITPWNFPMSMAHWMAVPALVAGNAVVLKPSEETPLIADAWAKRLQACLPPDVLQVVHGDEAQGKALVAADIDLVAFTGSRGAGAHILSAAGKDLKRVLLELGGKDPMVVLADADLDRAARFAARNAFRNTGQVCVSTERIYVDAKIAEPFVDKLVESASRMRIGYGLEEGVELGPMVNARQKRHVLGQVERACAEGAEMRYGAPEGEGNYLGPIVLTRVHHGMDFMREETFGPVVGVATFEAIDEAVELANDTPFGLGAVVFGDAEAEEVARRLDAGMIGINRGVGGASGSPWVGAKQSGYGFHSGPHGHRQFTQVRIISRPVS